MVIGLETRNRAGERKRPKKGWLTVGREGRELRDWRLIRKSVRLGSYDDEEG